MATYLGRTDLAPAYHLRAERFVNDSPLEAAGFEVAVPLAKNGRPDVRGGCEESPNIYPTFTYADDPARFVEGEATQQVFERKVGAYRERLWRQVETVVGAPGFLRPRFSALDIYIAVMTRWRPRRGWFQAECLGTRAVSGLFTAWSRGLDLHRHKDRRNGGRASMEEAFSARIKRPGSFMRILS